ncbi:MAG: cytochrome-c peroxidase [Bacteroidetes bacterium]|nr:cytochrome-c peroxidase [Bacteroidota bacterium]
MRLLVVKFICIALAISACTQPDSGSEEQLDLVVPGGFESVPIPSHNSLTKSKVLLGQQLFFDPILSVDSTVSCATCHIPHKFFSDGQVISQGIKGRSGTRNTPSLINIAYHKLFFWDGGSITLEHQIFGPLQNSTEMGIDLSSAIDRLESNETYRESFQDIFEEPPSLRGLTQSIAAYQRTLLSRGARYDSYRAGDKSALRPAERRGLSLFEGKAGCIHCHNGFLLTSLIFENNGLPISRGDSGRARVTGLREDYGKFKIPSLRNISETAPYMHDGRMVTLSEVIEHYNKGGNDVRGKSALIKPLYLNELERADLEAFLHSLTDSSIYAGLEIL